MKRKIFMLIWELDLDKGGINKAIQRRSRLLDNDEYDIELLTLDYKENYDKINDRLHKRGFLDPGTNIVNVNDYYRDKESSGTIGRKEKKFYDKEVKYHESGFFVEEHEKHARYYQNGLYVKFKRWRKNGSLSHIHYFNEQRVLTHRIEFHQTGYKTREIYYFNNIDNPVQELYFTRDGFCYLSKWYNAQTGKQEKVCLFSKKEKTVKTFKNNKQFHIYWLHEMCSKEKLKPFMICDGPGSAKKMGELQDDLVHKIFTIHTNHLAKPHTFGSKVKKNHQSILKYGEMNYPIVVLTDRQKADIINEFGEHLNVHVIPHYVDQVQKVYTKKNHIVSMLARLHEEKQIEHAIKAFSYVVTEEPKAELHIYGNGEEKEALNDYIKELGLQNHVFLRGYTNDANRVFGESIVSILTSKYEAFSFAIIESFINKTSVISYDVNYGPKDIITDGHDGYLIPEGDIEQLANRIIHLLKNPKLAEEMGIQGYQNVKENYSEGIHLQKWNALFENILATEK